MGGGGEHGRDAGDDGDIEGAPARGAGFECFEDRAGHGKDAWIAPGDKGGAVAAGGEGQRVVGACEFLAIVRGVADLARAGGEPFEIGGVADQVSGGVERVFGIGRARAGSTRAEADDAEPAGHRVRCLPGMSTSAK